MYISGNHDQTTVASVKAASVTSYIYSSYIKIAGSYMRRKFTKY